MKETKKKKLSIFPVSIFVVTLVMLAYQWFASCVYRDIVREIQFLIRENDAESAAVVLERNMPFFERSGHMSLRRLLELRLDLRKEGIKHVADAQQ